MRTTKSLLYRFMKFGVKRRFYKPGQSFEDFFRVLLKGFRRKFIGIESRIPSLTQCQPQMVDFFIGLYQTKMICKEV